MGTDSKHAPAPKVAESGRRAAISGAHDIGDAVGAFEIEAALETDLCFRWDSDERELEIHLLTVGGTIAGAYPRTVVRGEQLPIHRKFVSRSGETTWYLRVMSPHTHMRGLVVSVAFRDGLGHVETHPLCESLVLRAGHVTTIERSIPAFEEE